jgi:hypothetical protein
VGVARRLGKLEDADGSIQKTQRSYQEIQFDMGVVDVGVGARGRAMRLLHSILIAIGYRARQRHATRILEQGAPVRSLYKTSHAGRRMRLAHIDCVRRTKG